MRREIIIRLLLLFNMSVLRLLVFSIFPFFTYCLFYYLPTIEIEIKLLCKYNKLFVRMISHFINRFKIIRDCERFVNVNDIRVSESHSRE